MKSPCGLDEGCPTRYFSVALHNLRYRAVPTSFLYYVSSLSYVCFVFNNYIVPYLPLSHLGMFVTTGCSSRRQFVATASRQDTGSRQQNTDSGRQVTASGQFYKPSQTQESKYSSYALLLLCRLKWKNGSTFNELPSCNFCYLSLLNTSL